MNCEVHFYLHGFTNKQNFRFWRIKNTRDPLKVFTPTNRREDYLVVIDQYLSEYTASNAITIIVQCYREMLKHVFEAELEELELEKI